MLGPIVVFAVAVMIVATYMFIIHSFLRSAEEPADEQREGRLRQQESRPAPRRERTGGRTQFAH